MMNSSFRSLSKCFLYRNQCRTLTSQVNAKINKQVDINNGNYLTYYCTNGLENRRSFLSNSRPMLTNLSHANSRNLGVRNLSTASTFETINTVSRYLEGTPVDWFQNILVWTHSTTGLPWWATIIVNAAVLKICVTTPIQLYQTHTTARLENVRSEMEGFVWKLKRETTKNVVSSMSSEKMARRVYNRKVRDEMQKLYVRDNCHPVKVMTILTVQFGITLCQIFAIYNLCQMLPVSNVFAQVTHLELSLGGFGWIRDLTQPDSYHIMPIYMSLLSFSRIQAISFLNKTESSVKLVRILQKLQLVVFPLISLTLTSFMPAAVVLSWATYNTLSLGEFLLFSVPKVRRAVGIPVTMSEHSRPFSVLYQKIKEKYRLP